MQAMVFPVVTYGCESWTLRKSDRRRLDAFELWCWRRVLRIPWTAKRTNISILAEIGVQSTLEARVVKSQLSYFGHVMRANNMGTSIMLGRVEGNRRRGRPRIRWLDGVEEAAAMSLERLRNLIQDRKGWRGYVHGVTRSRKRLDGT